MGIFKKADMFLVTAALGIMLVSMVGCASSGQNFQNRTEFENPGQNQLTSLSGNKARPVFEERKIIAEEPLVEMTPGELERLGDIYLSRDNLYMAFVQYEKSLNLNPDNIRVRYKKGLVLVLGGAGKRRNRGIQEGPEKRT
jgi:tetratricopeptide (TPR) repeat protein